MAHNYSAPARRNMLATSANESFLTLIEITHPGLVVPARFVCDDTDIYLEGNRFYHCWFSLPKPDDVDQQLPQAKLEVDNIGRELTQWLEASNGGRGAKCRMISVLRSSVEEYASDYFADDYTRASEIDIEYDMTLDLSGISVTYAKVSGSLGFQNTLTQAAVAMRFDQTTAPPLF